ncbi:MAG: adenylate and guanylate cyclase catalytic protein [candidate division NC10 bacterium]|nr:adenylate and guanylate cyclase catalytic protein [candidate division NC10 bacterium]
MRGVEACISGSRTLSHKTGVFLGRALPAYFPKKLPIAYKLALTFTLIISSGMVVLGWVVARDQTVLLEQQMVESSRTVVQQLAQIAKEPVLADDTLTLEVIVKHLNDQRGLLAAAIYSDEIKPIVQAGIVPDTTLVAEHSTKSSMFLYTKAANDGGERVTVMAAVSPMTVDGLTVGYALIGFDRSIVESAKHQTIRTVSLATLLFVLIGSLISIALGKRLARPIHEIIKISSAVSAGNYDVRFTKPRNDELGELMKAMNDMTEGLAQKERVEQTFSRYVAPQVAREVLRDTAQAGAVGRNVNASVLFADIFGFTALSESMSADEINTLLNEYFGYIAHIVDACHGHIDKYIGDCVMAVFGVPESDPLHAQHALECAALIQYLVETLNKRRSARGQVVLMFHIGINSGAMLAGNIGAADRMDYTVMGKEVNVAKPSHETTRVVAWHHRSQSNIRLRQPAHVDRQCRRPDRSLAQPTGVWQGPGSCSRVERITLPRDSKSSGNAREDRRPNSEL